MVTQSSLQGRQAGTDREGVFDADILAVQRLEGLQLRSQGQTARTDDVSHRLDVGLVGFGEGHGNKHGRLFQ